MLIGVGVSKMLKNQLIWSSIKNVFIFIFLSMWENLDLLNEFGWLWEDRRIKLLIFQYFGENKVRKICIKNRNIVDEEKLIQEFWLINTQHWFMGLVSSFKIKLCKF